MRNWTRWVITLTLSALVASTGCGGGASTPATPNLPGIPDGDVTPAPVAPIDPGPADPDAPAPSSRDVSGLLMTTTGLPVPGATITSISGIGSSTDMDGRFQIIGLTTDATFIAVSAAGYTVHSQAIPAGTTPFAMTIVISPLPADAVPAPTLSASVDLTGTTIAFPVAGPNLAYDYYIYRRENADPFDFNAPLNDEPIRQAVANPAASGTVGNEGDTLTYRDASQVGGASYHYTVRLKDSAGNISAPSPEVEVTGLGLGRATVIDGTDSLTLLDTVPGSNGSLVALYRDLSYQPWHRFIAKRFDGNGGATELFRSEGVYDDAKVFTDLNDVPYFFYRRNGIEFLFETYLLNYWDQTLNEVSWDIRVGQSQRKITEELAGAMHFRTDPEGIRPMETVAVYVNRDRQIVTQSWDNGDVVPRVEELLGAIPHTYKPYLQTIQNRDGDIAVAWNLASAGPGAFNIGFIHGSDVLPGDYLGEGPSMALRLGVTAQDDFIAAFAEESDTSVIQLRRYTPTGISDWAASIDLSTLATTLKNDPARLAFAALRNGKTILLAILTTGGGDRELHAWDISDLAAIQDLGPLDLGGSTVPAAITVRPDRSGNLHIVTTEGVQTLYRRFYLPWG